jgi:hypothetical protein
MIPLFPRSRGRGPTSIRLARRTLARLASHRSTFALLRVCRCPEQHHVSVAPAGGVEVGGPGDGDHRLDWGCWGLCASSDQRGRNNCTKQRPALCSSVAAVSPRSDFSSTAKSHLRHERGARTQFRLFDLRVFVFPCEICDESLGLRCSHRARAHRGQVTPRRG